MNHSLSHLGYGDLAPTVPVPEYVREAKIREITNALIDSGITINGTYYDISDIRERAWCNDNDADVMNQIMDSLAQGGDAGFLQIKYNKIMTLNAEELANALVDEVLAEELLEQKQFLAEEAIYQADQYQV